MVDSVSSCGREQRNSAQVESLTLIQVIGSVAAAAFGVQSKANKHRDFTRGNPLHFIFAGALCTGILLASIIVIVNTVI